MRRHLLAILAVGAFAAAGCSSDSTDSTSSSTTAPTEPLVTENFSGTVQPGGNDVHSFTVTANNAGIALGLTSTSPSAAIVLGFGIGQTIAGSCQLLTSGFGNFAASTAPQLTGTVPSGTYCVMVYDPGPLVSAVTEAITYTVVIQHY